MEEKKESQKKNFSFDWLIGGVLTKLGDTFDRLTGRGWNPSSSLATSKLVEKLKFLLDSEVRDIGIDGKFVPHQIKLKIQWDKFSTDSEQDLEKLEHELHAAAIDHINDKLYHTYAPLNIEIKTDYFTEGVKMLSSFGRFSDEEDDEVSINVTVPQIKVGDVFSDGEIEAKFSDAPEINNDDRFIARYISEGKPSEIELNFSAKKRASVGRSKNNTISITDQSVSKNHAALVLSPEKQLMVADTGSTNGTFINGKRIAYGKAFVFEDDAKVKFGTVEVAFDRLKIETPDEVIDESNEIGESKTNVVDAELMVPIAGSFSTGVEPKQAAVKPLESGNAESTNPKQHEVRQPEASGQVDGDQWSVEEADAKKHEYENDENSQDDQDSEIINIDETQDWEI